MEKPFNLDILGQQPTLNIYTQLSLFFQVPDGDCKLREVAAVIKDGLLRLTGHFPWIAGQVVCKASKGNEPGVFVVMPWEILPPLVTSDLRFDAAAPTMAALRQSKFPMSMLDEALFAPYPTIPGGTAGSGRTPTAVFAVQVTQLVGGIALTFVAHHQVMDMTGQLQVMHLLSKACRGERPSTTELEAGNVDRLDFVPFVGEPSRNLEQQTTSADIPRLVNEPTESLWAYVSFSATAVATIKALALETGFSQYISTDDAITAFLWQSISRVRLKRLGSNPKSTLGRAVDARRYMGIPKEYPGLLNNMVYHIHGLRDLVSKPLGVIATELRQAVNPSTSTVGPDTRALVAALSPATDRGRISLTANINPSLDFMISSWANPGPYNLDFGLGLGNSVAVKRPRFIPVESLAYIMPKHCSGEMTVALCLAKVDMANLREDKEFSQYAEYIG